MKNILKEKFHGKKAVTLCLISIVGCVIGLILLLVSFLLPTAPMQGHVRESLDLLSAEFEDSEIVQGYEATLTGIFTDCLMLEHAVYSTSEYSILERALMMYRSESYPEEDGWAPGYSLSNFLLGIENSREVEYARYWHGYLIVLKPLLLFFNVNTLRMIAAMVQPLLVALFWLLCSKRNEGNLGMALCVGLPFLYSFSMYFSLSLSICYYIMMAALLIQMKWHDQLKDCHRYLEFFLIVGMCTSYFDFLTYPLVTLGMPLCVLLYLDKGEIAKKVVNLVGFTFAWGMGYIVMWASKWIFTDLLLGHSVIKDAFNTIVTRTGKVENHSLVSSYIEVLLKNLDPYMNQAFLMLLLGMIIALIIILVKSKKNWNGKRFLQQAIPFFIVMLYPLLWFFMTQNHAGEHWQFTCKIFAVDVFAMIFFVLKLQKKEE